MRAHGTCPGGGASCRALQRRTAPVRMTARESMAEAPALVHDVLSRPGQPLAPADRTFFGRRLGHDFAEVRVHTDDEAARSVASVGADAYTVGPHIAFGSGRYAPETPQARRLLGHELAHVLQQRGLPPGPSLRIAPATDPLEREADLIAAGAAPRSTPTARLLQRQPVGGGVSDPVAAEAFDAQMRCDLGKLCALHWSKPEAVTVTQVRGAYVACRGPAPATHPCLSLDPVTAGKPAAGPGGIGPVPAARPAAMPGAPGSAGLKLPKLDLEFSLGPANFKVSVPSSATAKLPIQLSRSSRITLAIGATTGGEFATSVTLDGVPHVRLSIQAKAALGKEGKPGQISGGLTIQTTRTVCRAPSAGEAEAKLKSAGEKLRDAILKVQNPPAEKDGSITGPAGEALRWGELGGALAKVVSTIDDLKKPCKEVPLVSVEFGAKGPLGTIPPGSEKDLSPFLGGSVTFHF